MADGKFDDLLLAMAQRHKTTEELSYSILSFFERRTDLFHIMETPTDRMGFKPGVAEDMLFKHFHHFQHRYLAREQPEIMKEAYGVADGGGSASSGAPALKDAAAAPALYTSPASAAIAEAAEAAGYPSATSAAPTAPAAPAAGSAAGPAAASAATGTATASGAGASSGGDSGAQAELALPEKTRKMMKHISTWNGAVTDKYHWSQSLSEVTFEVEVEECRARDIKVDVIATRLKITCKGNVVLEGKLHEKVNTEETMWHLDDNRQIVLSLEKQRETWWKCVLEGDQEIDTTKVESTRGIDEYDGETQGAIRKIMFDQNQKVQGKPTSDQIRTADMMKEAWNAEGSPFRGSEFDPSMLNLSSPVPDEFFEDLQKKRIEDARRRKVEEADESAEPGGAS